MRKKIRVAIITNIVSPYRIPFFEEIASLVESFKVFLMAEKEENRHWQLGNFSFPIEILPGIHLRPPGYETSVHINYRVSDYLGEFRPDIVLSGGFSFANIQAALYCKRNGVKYVGWGEVTLRDSSARSLARKLVRRYLTRISVGTIASSSEAKEAFVSYGAVEADTLISLLPIDVEHYNNRDFSNKSILLRNRLKNRFPGRILLSIGQLIPRKGFKEMLKILEVVRSKYPDVSLVILGEGPSRKELEEIIGKRQLANIFIEGFVNADDVPVYLSIADVFVFHTLFDTFGAVLSEAMAARSIVVSSIYACATRDLVIDGVNGFVIDPLRLEESAGAVIKSLQLDDVTRLSMAECAYCSVKPHNYRDSARAIVDYLGKL